MQNRVEPGHIAEVVAFCPNRMQRVNAAILRRFPAGANLADEGLRNRLVMMVAGISVIEARIGMRDLSGLRDWTEILAEIAAEMGFPDLQRAATNAGDCLGATDAAAIAATLARVVRLGKSSLDQLSALRQGDG
jgi:hypothetical protein